jgi:chromosome segregation ATPase
LYGQDAANLLTYETQLTTTKSALDDAEQALATFQANNQVAILTAQLNSQQAILTDYLNRVHQFGLLVQDAQDLRARLAKLDASAPSSFTDDLITLMLSAQTFGGQMASLQSQPSLSQPSLPSQSSLPLQVQISSGQSLSGKSVAEQAAVVDDLLDTLRARAEDAKTQTAALEPKILDLQGKLAEAQKQQAELTRARDLAQTQYLTLASKVEEAKIAAQESANVVQVASEATTPTEKVSPKLALMTAVGGSLGFLLSLLLVFGREWWRGGSRTPQPASLVNPLQPARADGDAVN